MQVRAASELSVAGSEMGGRFSEDDQGYSMDGRFSCSSLYSEFGHVASHLEERHPGLVLARFVLLGVTLACHLDDIMSRAFASIICHLPSCTRIVSIISDRSMSKVLQLPFRWSTGLVLPYLRLESSRCLLRTSMRPHPPRSVTSEASAPSELPPRRSLEDATLQLLSQHGHALSLRHSGDPIAARQDAQIADAASDLAARLQGDLEQSSGRTSREATRHGQHLNAWVENDAERWAGLESFDTG